MFLLLIAAASSITAASCDTRGFLYNYTRTDIRDQDAIQFGIDLPAHIARGDYYEERGDAVLECPLRGIARYENCAPDWPCPLRNIFDYANCEVAVEYHGMIGGTRIVQGEVMRAAGKYFIETYWQAGDGEAWSKTRIALRHRPECAQPDRHGGRFD